MMRKTNETTIIITNREVEGSLWSSLLVAILLYMGIVEVEVVNTSIEKNKFYNIFSKGRIYEGEHFYLEFRYICLHFSSP